MTGVVLVLIYFAMAALAAVIVMQPDRFVVSRSAMIDAPPGKVFGEINDLRRWEAWAPWPRFDPDAAWGYSGPQAGAGAVQVWSGKKIGEGRVTIVESVPNERIDMKLDLRKPLAQINDVRFSLEPEDGGARTKVTWTMTGRAKLFAKAMNLVVNREKMLGGHFEQGLANLNAVLTS